MDKKKKNWGGAEWWAREAKKEVDGELKEWTDVEEEGFFKSGETQERMY